MAFNNYLEDENDKPYFTTNSLAYYYDKMEGFAKAVEGSAKALNLTKEEVEKRLTLYIEQNKNELDQRLAQWDGKLETFDSSVETLLTEWVDDGTLISIIDSTLIDQKIAPVAIQLAETTAKVVQVGNRVKTFAHRGAEGYCPENTLKSIELAKQIGFDGIELDVLVTSDGVPVLMHDDTVDRTTNGVGFVKDKTLAEIKALTIDAGNFVSWYSGLKVPTLEEALMLCKKEGLEVIVEIKTFSPSEVSAVEKIIAKLGMYETTYILAPYQLAQSLETLNSKLRGMIFHSTNVDFKTALTKPNIVAVGIYPESNVTQNIVDEIREYGLLINVATIITAESARRMTDMGIDLITGGVSHV